MERGKGTSQCSEAPSGHAKLSTKDSTRFLTRFLTPFPYFPWFNSVYKRTGSVWYKVHGRTKGCGI